MNAFELFNEKGQPTNIWACGKCRSLTLGHGLINTREAAEKCCEPDKCRHCGKDIEHNKPFRVLAHEECERADRRRKEVERLEKAEEVTSGYDSWLYSDDVTGYRDGFWTDMGELLDHLEDEEDIERPEFVFCCHEISHLIDLGHVLENLCEEGYDEMADRLETKELEKAIEAFHELNKDALRSYQPDYKRKVRVPKIESLERSHEGT